MLLRGLFTLLLKFSSWPGYNWRHADPVSLGGAVKLGLLRPYFVRVHRLFVLPCRFRLALLRSSSSSEIFYVFFFFGFDISEKGVRVVFFDDLLELPQMFLDVLALLL